MSAEAGEAPGRRSEERNAARVHFHACGGGNICFSNRGNTATKLNEYSKNCWAMSSRPLHSNEWFSVILKVPETERDYSRGSDHTWLGVTTTSPEEMKDHESPCQLNGPFLSNECFSAFFKPSVRGYSRGNDHTWIGVTTTSPEEMKDHESPCQLKNNCWLVRFHKGAFAVFKDGKELNAKYGEYPSRKQNGFRYSISRRSNGDLRFCVNGLDLGVAANGVPDGVYAYVFLSDHDKKLLICPSIAY